MWIQPDYEVYYKVNPNDPNHGTIVGVFPDIDYTDPPEHTGMFLVEPKIGEEFINGSWSPSSHYVELVDGIPRIVKDTSVQRYLEYATIRSMTDGVAGLVTNDPDMLVTMFDDRFVVTVGEAVRYGIMVRVVASPIHSKLPFYGGGSFVTSKENSVMTFGVADPEYKVWISTAFLDVSVEDKRSAN